MIHFHHLIISTSTPFYPQHEATSHQQHTPLHPPSNQTILHRRLLYDEESISLTFMMDPAIIPMEFSGGALLGITVLSLRYYLSHSALPRVKFFTRKYVFGRPFPHFMTSLGITNATMSHRFSRYPNSQYHSSLSLLKSSHSNPEIW
jgi:hypothetical protein